MTTNKAREIFRIECDSRSVGAYDTFIVGEIDHFISFAIRQFYERRLSGFTKDGTSFEEWQKRTEDLRPVYGKYTRNNPGISNKRGCRYSSINLPDEDELWHILSEECVFSLSDTGGEQISSDVYECTTDNLTSRINNSLGDHIYYAGKVRPLRLFTFEDSIADPGKFGSIVEDSPGGPKRTMVSNLYFKDPEAKLESLVSYTIEYIKPPGKFGTTDPLYSESLKDERIYHVPAYAWDEVISIAVAHALENIGSPRMNTYSHEQQLIQ